MIYKSSEEFFSHLKLAYLQKRGPVWISTFNMYLNITPEKDYQNEKPSQVRSFIDSINKNDLRLIIGIPNFSPCAPDCPHCISAYNRKIDRIKHSMETLGIKNVRYSNSMHMKLYYVGGEFYTGGINLTSSGFLDFSIKMMKGYDISLLKAMFEKVWNESKININGFYHKDLFEI